MDKRGKKIIYLSNCLLNQNLRFPGIAVESGAITDLLSILTENGIGIETLPCLERIGWGGVSRKTFYKFLPIVDRNIGKKKFFLIKIFIKIWIRHFKKLCRKEAKKIVKQIQNYIESGYSIKALITTNDSPTCGITKTINLINLISKYKDLGITMEDLENPEIEKMKNLIKNLLEDGSGLFMTKVIKQLKRRKINIKIIGFDIWNDFSEEIEKEIREIL